MKDKTDSWKVPGFRYKFYDDDRVEALLKDYFSKEVLLAYNNLNPYAFKVDLFRYCALYVHGGIYVDVDLKLKGKLDFLDEFDFAVGLDKGKGRLLNGLIFSVPNNPIFLESIRQIVLNVHYCRYGNSSLDVTGPALFGKVVGIYENGIHFKHGLKIKIFDTFQSEHSFFNKIVEYSKLDEYPFPWNHYSSIWNRKMVFRNESMLSWLWNLTKVLLQKFQT